MASELRFAFKRNRPNNRNAANNNAQNSPGDSDGMDHHFHPLGPPYSPYDFEPKTTAH
jgi:hypothetical protein